MKGVYLHIPFCEKRCNYCAFSSFVNLQEIDNYIDHLCQEIENSDGGEIDTIYIGGGTPSLLSIEQFKKIFESIKNKFSWKRLEFTIECNPNSLEEEKLIEYKKCGVNRLSIGVQSLNDDKLKFIGRIHDKNMAIQKIALAKKYFDNISADMLIGLKDMNKEEFLKELDELLSLGVQHVSAYMLQVEEGTPLYAMTKHNKSLLPSDDECVEVYEEAVKFLKEIGFNRYEVSNFAREGYESKHNFKYWTGEEYIGFGLGAHSYLGGKRIANVSTFKGYYSGEKTIEKLTIEEKIEEHIMLGLRCKAGVDLQKLSALGYDLKENDNLKDFISRKIVSQKGDKIYLNPDFYGVNNYIIVKLIP